VNRNQWFIKEAKKLIKAKERALAELRGLKSSCGSSINTDWLNSEISALEDDIASLRLALNKAKEQR